ncbi:MAG: CDP-alcohol phosphatidyltransferase family protein [Halobacteriales archaeon]
MSGATATDRLRCDWTVVGLALAAGLSAGVVWLSRGAPPARVDIGLPAAVQWAVPAGVAAAFVLWFSRAHLDANRADAESNGPSRRYATLGLANAVTLARGGLFAAVAGFLAVEPTSQVAWLPAVCYGAGCVLDLADGAIARRRDRTTVLGAKLDMAVDTLGFLVAPVVAVAWGRLPVWYLSLSAARYLFKPGRGYRRRRGRPVYDLPASLVRRPLAGVQMAFITVALAPALPAAVVRSLAALVLAPSLAVFARDYLVVAGHLGAGSAD